MVPTPTQRLAELGIVLPPPPAPVGSYRPVVLDGTTAFVSGQIVTKDGAVLHPGLVDREVPSGTAKELARLAALQALSALTAELGSLDRVRQIVRVGVFVAVSDGFASTHEVANGATDVLVEVFGDAGRPARATVGVARLPKNAPVEVELVARVG